MFRIWTAFRRFWETDRGLSLLLFFLLVLVFVVPATELTGALAKMVFDALFTLLIVAGVMSLGTQRGAQVVVGVIAVSGLVVRWLGHLVPSLEIDVAIASSGLASIVTLAVVVLAQVFRAGPVNPHRILGAIAGYLLLGLAWAEAYTVVGLIVPTAFVSAHTQPLGPQALTYFSFVTLTTVGYGDITPVTPVARSLAILEALTGQLYLAILLARLVALEVGSKSNR